MVPTARIWTYSYKSSVWMNPSEDALALHCSRSLDLCTREGVGVSVAKVGFVGHSLGSILIKSVCELRTLEDTKLSDLESHFQSVIYASLAPKASTWAALKDLADSMVFLDTSHRGSEWANRLHLALLGPTVFWQSSSFVTLLQKGNLDLLATIAEKFNNMWGQKSILTFRETVKTRLTLTDFPATPSPVGFPEFRSFI